MSTSTLRTKPIASRLRGSAVRLAGAIQTSRRAQAGLALAFYVAMALYVTWPWILHPGSTLFGISGGDLTGGVAPYQQFANQLHPPFIPGRIDAFNAPEGLVLTWSLYLAGVGSSAALWLLSVAFGAVAAFGVMAVCGFALSAFAMFLLVRHITDHPGASFAVGLAYGFWPYTYTTGWTWPHYIQLWVFVLLTWRMLVVAENPTLRNGFWAGLAALFAMTWIQYNWLLGGVLFLTLSVVALVYSAIKRQFLYQVSAQLLAGTMIAVSIGAILLTARLDGYAGVPVRSAGDSIVNSARPAEYVVPGPLHPIFGSLTSGWIARHFSGPAGHPPSSATYSAIYLGIPLLLFAAVGALWVLRPLWRRPSRWRGDRREFAGIAALAVGVTAFIFSLPPEITIFGHNVPTPYYVVNQLTTVFRVAERFSTILMLAVCVLAGLALTRLLGGRRIAFQCLAIGFVSVVFAVDLTAIPKPRATRTAVAPIYQALARQPRGIVAEYPLAPQDLAVNNEALRPDMPQHPSFTGYDPGSLSESRKDELSFLGAPRTAPDLAAYGVRYVIADAGDVPRHTPPGLRRIVEAGGSVLYRVTAALPKFISFADQGFYTTEGNSPGVRWMYRNGAELHLWGACSPCDGTLTFGSGTFVEPRDVTIYGPANNLLLKTLIRTAAQPVSVHVHFTGQTFLRFFADPPAVQVSRFVRTIDTRSFAIFVGQPVRFIPDAANRWTGGGVRITGTALGEEGSSNATGSLNSSSPVGSQ